jgi:hypothetical protein
MTSIASSLLDFLLSLFRDPEAAAAYAADPRAALDEAGLYDVEPDDVAALQPMVEDSCSLGYGGGGSEDDGADHRPALYGGHKDYDREDDGGRPSYDNNHGGSHGGHDVVAVTHVKLVEHKSITEVDVDIDARNSVWAGGDAIAIWGDDVVLATGGSVAAGDDVEDVEVDNSTEIDVELEDSFNDNSTTTNSNNTGTNIADRGGEVEDNDISVEDSNGTTIAGGDVDQSTEVDIEDSLNGNEVAGRDINETDVDVDIEDSLNGNEVAGRDINETDVDTDVDIEDSFNPEDESVTIDDITVDASEDNSTEVEIEDSLNENAIAVDDALANTGDVDIDD